MQSVHIPALSTSPSSQHAGKQVDLAQVLADSLAMYTDKIANKDTRDVTPDMLQVSNFIPRQSQPVYDVDEAVDGLAPFSHNSKTETSEYFLQADEEEEDEDEDAVCHITSVMHRSAIKELQCAINSLTLGLCCIQHRCVWSLRATVTVNQFIFKQHWLLQPDIRNWYHVILG